MKQKQSGFTIIEVVLVLGIAGLIFLMAFIALPSLWISQRDAKRKSTVMEVISDLKIYQTNNNRGALPTLEGTAIKSFVYGTSSSDTSSWEYFVSNYVKSNETSTSNKRLFVDASGNSYRFYVVNCLSSSGGSLSTGAACAYPSSTFGSVNNANTVDVSADFKNPIMYIAAGATCDGDHAVKSNSPRSAAAVQVLERGGRYCHNT